MKVIFNQIEGTERWLFTVSHKGEERSVEFDSYNEALAFRYNFDSVGLKRFLKNGKHENNKQQMEQNKIHEALSAIYIENENNN